MIEERKENFLTGKIIIVLLAIVVLVVGFSSFAIVGPGERGVLTTLGSVEPYSLGEGIHFKTPIIQRVALVDVKTQKIEAGASAASKDLQVVTTTIALNYKVNPDQAWLIYQQVGMDYKSRIIDPAIQEAVKASTAHFTAEELITKRAAVNLEIEELLKTRLSKYNINVQSLSLTNFDFSPEFNAAIEAKVKAEQDALKAERELVRIKVEKEQAITQAEAQNERVKLEADAEAYAIKAKADSEAYALQVIREQLTQNAKLIDYEAVQKWDGSVPNYMLGSGVVPFINLNETN
jgi:regulator of protease activity HflC (stomatin/prohibitin superfamily)